MAKRQTPAHTAMLILINAKLYEREREKEISRYRFSLQSLRRISGRRAIRDRFVSELDDELAELGWHLIQLGNEFAVMELEKLESWVKLSSKRLDEPGYLTLSGEQLEGTFEMMFPQTSDDTSDD
jgi:hypothetical protein